jgi:pimeloyl-ACP methyl ester carboxylesterase
MLVERSSSRSPRNDGPIAFVLRTVVRSARFTPALVLSFVACVIAAPIAHATPPARGDHHADVNGIRMFYAVRGDGPVLVLLHGGAGNGEQFAHQIPELEKHYTLIIPDMCAQGRTTDRPGPLTYHAMAEDVIALMDLLGIKRLDIMGWSDGGVTGIDLAIHHAGRLKHLVTFGANFSPDGLNPADVAWNDTATVSAFGDGMREGWMKLNPEPAHYDSALSKVLHMWKTLPRFPTEELGSIRTRVMICAGEHDVIRPDHTQALARAIPNAIVWVVPNASHSAMIEQPALVNARVLAFLAR